MESSNSTNRRCIDVCQRTLYECGYELTEESIKKRRRELILSMNPKNSIPERIMHDKEIYGTYIPNSVDVKRSRLLELPKVNDKVFIGDQSKIIEIRNILYRKDHRIILIYGPSGCGKSFSLNYVLDLLNPNLRKIDVSSYYEEIERFLKQPSNLDTVLMRLKNSFLKKDGKIKVFICDDCNNYIVLYNIIRTIKNSLHSQKTKNMFIITFNNEEIFDNYSRQLRSVSEIVTFPKLDIENALLIVKNKMGIMENTSEEYLINLIVESDYNMKDILNTISSYSYFYLKIKIKIEIKVSILKSDQAFILNIK